MVLFSVTHHAKAFAQPVFEFPITESVCEYLWKDIYVRRSFGVFLKKENIPALNDSSVMNMATFGT